MNLDEPMNATECLPACPILPGWLATAGRIESARDSSLVIFLRQAGGGGQVRADGLLPLLVL